MPITILHFPVALPVKIIRGDKVSVKVFVASNILMDAEPIFKILVGVDATQIHGYSHNMIVVVLFSMIVRLVTRSKVIGESVLWGTVTHTIVDAMVHSDMTPFAPLSNDNPFYFDAMLSVSVVLYLLTTMSLMFFVNVPWSNMAKVGRTRLAIVQEWLIQICVKLHLLSDRP